MATKAEVDAAWIAGHQAGYVKGRDDGISIGYTDAKLRAYRALDAVLDSSTPATASATREVEIALKSTVGGR